MCFSRRAEAPPRAPVQRAAGPFGATLAWLLAMLVVAASAVAAGCSYPAATTAQASSRRRNGGVTEIRFWNGFTGPDGKAMEALVRAFEAENPDVRVRMQIIPWGTYYDKLTLALAYGGAPDVFILHAVRLPEYAGFGTLRPLGDLFAGAAPASSNAALSEANFAPVPWRASFYDGKQFALPLDVHPVGLYYNTRLFEQARIVDAAGRAKPPATWDEFLAAAKKLTRDTNNDGRPDQWGFVFTNQRTNWITFAAQHGGTILTPDNRRAAINSPECLAATQQMRDLIYKYRVAPKPEGVDAWLAFRQGKVAMALEGIYMLSSLEEQKGLAFAGAPVPQFGSRPAVEAGSHLLCQPAGISAAQADAAWRFMRFVSDHSIVWAKGGQVPARRDVAASPEFAALPVQREFARQLPITLYEPLSPRANALFPFVDPAIEATLLDLQTPEQAMNDAARRINQVLSRP